MCQRNLFLSVALGLLCVGAEGREPHVVVAQCRAACADLHADMRVAFEHTEQGWRVHGVTVAAPNLARSRFARLAAIETIRSLEIHNPGSIPAAQLGKLAGLPELRRLAVAGDLKDDGLRAILGLRQLEDLDLSEIGPENGAASLDAFRLLKNMTALRRLNVPILPSGVQFLKPLTKLDELEVHLKGEDVDPGLSSLPALTGLVSLHIEHLRQEGVAALKNCPRLERLSVGAYDCGSGEPGLTELRCLRCLRVNSIITDGSRQVRLPATLRWLRLPQELAAKLDIATCKNVESVQVSMGWAPRRYSAATGRWDNPSDLKWLGSLPHLRKLQLEDPNDEDLKQIARFTSLQALTLAGGCPDAQFGDRGMKALALLPQLESLRIDNGWGVTDSALESLPRFPRLDRLELTYYFRKLTARGMAAVWKLERLRALAIDLYDPPIRGMAPHLKTLSNLVELYLGDVATDQELEDLAELKKLRRLDLTESVGFTDAGLATLMSKSPNLQSLEVMFRCDRVEHDGHERTASSEGPNPGGLAVMATWSAHAAIALILSAPVLFLGRKRAHWHLWELLAVILPFAVWAILFASPLSVGRKSLENLVEAGFLAIGVPMAALVRVAISSWLSEPVCAGVIIALLCVVAVAIFFAVPPFLVVR